MLFNTDLPNFRVKALWQANHLIRRFQSIKNQGSILRTVDKLVFTNSNDLQLNNENH